MPKFISIMAYHMCATNMGHMSICKMAHYKYANNMGKLFIRSSCHFSKQIVHLDYSSVTLASFI